MFEAYLPSENEGGWGKESFLPAILRTSLSTVFTYLGKQGDTCMNYELYLQRKREDICCGICPKPHFLHSPEGSPDLTRVASIVYIGHSMYSILYIYIPLGAHQRALRVTRWKDR